MQPILDRLSGDFALKAKFGFRAIAERFVEQRTAGGDLFPEIDDPSRLLAHLGPQRHRRIGGDAEAFVELFRRGGGTEMLHADEDAVLAQQFFPALLNARFNSDALGGGAAGEDVVLIGFGLLEEQFHAGHGDDAGGDACGFEFRLRFDREHDLRPGGHDDDARYAAFCFAQHIGAAGAEIIRRECAAQMRQGLPEAERITPIDVVDNYVDNVLSQQISQMPGVGGTFIAGEQKPAVRVQIDPAAIANQGISLEDVRAALTATSVNAPKGSIDGEVRSYTIYANDQAKTALATILGKDEPYRALPWFWSDQYDCKLQIAGLHRGYDDVVVRPGKTERSQSVWYYRGEQLQAVDAMSDAAAFVTAKKLLERGASVPKAMAADPASEFKTWLS